MGFFDKLLGKEKAESKDTVQFMTNMAELAMAGGEYEKAVKIYKDLLSIRPDADAQYNLGSLYAQGKGVEQNFMEGAYWFHQAELGGDEQAGKLFLKCALDFVHQDFASKTAEQIYFDMVKFIKYAMREAENVNAVVCGKLYGMAGNHFNKKEYAAAAKLFRAAGEYGSHGPSQNYLGVLYNAGAGVEKDDLAALYWLDKAMDNGAADLAKQDRDGILNSYKTNLSPMDFAEVMMTLSGWCSLGTADVPKDPEKAAYWKMMGKQN